METRVLEGISAICFVCTSSAEEGAAKKERLIDPFRLPFFINKVSLLLFYSIKGTEGLGLLLVVVVKMGIFTQMRCHG